MIVCLPGSETMGTGMGTMPWVWVRIQVLHVKRSLVWVQDHIHGYRYRVFILGGGTGGSPHPAKILPIPPSDKSPRFWTKVCPPPSRGSSPKILKI